MPQGNRLETTSSQRRKHAALGFLGEGFSQILTAYLYFFLGR